VVKLTAAKTPLQGGGEGVLEYAVRYCLFCGKAQQGGLRAAKN
jgi:hypothetical protein